MLCNPMKALLNQGWSTACDCLKGLPWDMAMLKLFYDLRGYYGAQDGAVVE